MTTKKTTTSSKAAAKATAKPAPKKAAAKPAAKPAAKAAAKPAAKKPAAKKAPAKKPGVAASKPPAAAKPKAAAAAKPLGATTAKPKAPAPKPKPAPAPSLTERIKGWLDADKAEEIVSIDLAGKSAMADAMIVASGRSTRHVSAMAQHVLENLKKSGAKVARAEGLQRGDWVLIDAGDVIVHLFRPEVRKFYALEKLWMLDDAGPDQVSLTP